MLILASSSPRRQELLRKARILYRTEPAHIAEVPGSVESPRDFVRRLAREKARAVYDRLQPPAGTFVLGADTTVVVDGQILNKPADEQDAARMLHLLSGRRHEVTTGVCLLGTGSAAPAATPGEPGIEDVRSETTQVCFCPLREEEIEEYVATGEPMDKAGAYAIQGAASRWIPRIEGCYFNVVGLPVPLICRMLREHGAL